jgi:ribosomal protein S12 methylthiotransferase
VEVDNEVIVHSTKKLMPGDFVSVKITKAYDYDLEGNCLS